jgi:TRAP-type mannitol/chloroaromatic compound transport system permease small subunit
MNVLLRIASIIDAINERIGRWSSWLVVIMVAIGVWNVIARYVGQFIGVNLASNTYIELQWYLFSIVFFLGAAYVLLKDEHVRVDVLYNRMSPRRRAWINLLGSALFLIPFCLIVLYVSWRPVSFSWRIMEGSPDPGGLPRYPIKSMIMVCFSLLLLQGISEIIKSAAILTGHREAPEALSEAEHLAREAAAAIEARPQGGA